MVEVMRRSSLSYFSGVASQIVIKLRALGLSYCVHNAAMMLAMSSTMRSRAAPPPTQHVEQVAASGSPLSLQP